MRENQPVLSRSWSRRMPRENPGAAKATDTIQDAALLKMSHIKRCTTIEIP